MKEIRVRIAVGVAASGAYNASGWKGASDKDMAEIAEAAESWPRDHARPERRQARDDRVAWAVAHAAVAAAQDRWPSPMQILQDRAVDQVMQATIAALDKLAERTETVAADGADRIIQLDVEREARLIASQVPDTEQPALARMLLGRTGHAATEAMRQAWASGEDARADVQLAVTSRIRTDAIGVITARTGRQIHSDVLPLSDDAVDVMRRELIRGIDVGANPRQAAARMLQQVEGGFNGGLARALNISRTEMLDAYRTTSAAIHQANSDVVPAWSWYAEFDDRVCPACLGMHGTQHPTSEPGPEGHQQCIPSGAIVEGPLPTASTARRYVGEVVDIETVDGRFLTVTPNHPILTPQGWVAAGELCEGGDVVCGSGLERVPVSARPHDHQSPALIEDVAEALSGSGVMESVAVPTAAEDFHGDGVGSEINVIRTDGFLERDPDTSVGNPGGELTFLGRRMSRRPPLALLSGRSASQQGSVTLGLSTLGGLCREHQAAVLLRGTQRGHQLVRGGLGTKFDTGILEAPVDDVARYAELLGESIGRLASLVPLNDRSLVFLAEGALGEQTGGYLPGSQSVGLGPAPKQSAFGQNGPKPLLADPPPSRRVLATHAGDVVLDRLLHVSRRSYAGHVFNLQTVQGWYLANGIVTHNCRCTRLPVVASWEELGIRAPEPPSELPDAEAWFWALPRAAQLRIMGPGRLRLLEDGRVGWGDLSTVRQNPRWRQSRVPTPLRDLQQHADRGLPPTPGPASAARPPRPTAPTAPRTTLGTPTIPIPRPRPTIGTPTLPIPARPTPRPTIGTPTLPAPRITPTQRVQRGDFSQLTQVGPQRGSNPGGLYQAADGSRWYIKAMPEDRARNEALAAALYRAAGVRVPQVHLGRGAPGLGGDWQVASRVVDDATAVRSAAQVRSQLREGFGVDAWLGNWDVAGASWDNVVLAGGNVWRIDAGGSLRFRARGTPKGAAFSDNVDEWLTLRDPSRAPVAAEAFRGMTPAELAAAARRVQRVTPETIRNLVRAHGLDDELAALLVRRRSSVTRRLPTLQEQAKRHATYERARAGALANEQALDSVPRRLTLGGGEARITPTPSAWTPVQAESAARAALNYQGSGYDQLNTALRDARGGVPIYVRSSADNLDRAISSSQLPNDVLTYRGFGNPDRFIHGWNDVDTTGLTWIEHGYTSVSTDVRVASGFSSGGVVIRVVVPRGTPGLRLSDMAAQDAFPAGAALEAEIVAGRGTTFRVVADHGVVDGRRMLDVEIVQ